MSTLPSPLLYVYILFRPDNTVFYVGKGQGNRVLRHEQEARRGCECHKCRTIRQIWSTGGEVGHTIIFETNDESEAFQVERETIALYGRENLTNQTDGGDGVSGFRHAIDTVRKIADALRGKPHTEERRHNISEAHKGIVYGPPSDETRRRISDATKGGKKRSHSPEMNQRKSERQKGRERPVFSDEWRQNLSESHQGQEPWIKGRQHSEETRRKMREAWVRRKQRQPLDEED